MHEFLIFLIKASISVLIVWILYSLFLKNKPNFQGSRMFILGALIMGMTLAWVKIPVSMESGEALKNSMAWEIWWSHMDVYGANTSETIIQSQTQINTFGNWNWPNYVWMIYLIGIAIATIRLTYSAFSLGRIIKNCKASYESQKKIYSSPYLKHSFSFFRYIFLGRELDHLPANYRKLVIEHESVHIKQMHSLDLLFMEILSIIFWFHPAISKLKNSLRDIHEYIADREVSRLMGRHPYSRLLIYLNHQSDLPFPVNHFAHSQTKNRIMMVLTKKPTKKSVLIAPVVMMLFCCLAMACTPEIEPAETSIWQIAAKDYQSALEINLSEPGPEDVPSIHPVPDHKHIVSGFGMRMHPFLKKEMFHNGIDIKAPLGAGIVATASGKVIVAGVTENKAYGKQIQIQHANGILTQYTHMDEVLVEKGQDVEQGSLIGKVGNTGLSKGPHLHYSIKKDGKYVDPLGYLQKQ